MTHASLNTEKRGEKLGGGWRFTLTNPVTRERYESGYNYTYESEAIQAGKDYCKANQIERCTF